MESLSNLNNLDNNQLINSLENFTKASSSRFTYIKPSEVNADGSVSGIKSEFISVGQYLYRKIFGISGKEREENAKLDVAISDLNERCINLLKSDDLDKTQKEKLKSCLTNINSRINTIDSYKWKVSMPSQTKFNALVALQNAQSNYDKLDGQITEILNGELLNLKIKLQLNLKTIVSQFIDIDIVDNHGDEVSKDNKEIKQHNADFPNDPKPLKKENFVLLLEEHTKKMLTEHNEKIKNYNIKNQNKLKNEVAIPDFTILKELEDLIQNEDAKPSTVEILTNKEKIKNECDKALIIFKKIPITKEKQKKLSNAIEGFSTELEKAIDQFRIDINKKDNKGNASYNARLEAYTVRFEAAKVALKNAQKINDQFKPPVVHQENE